MKMATDETLTVAAWAYQQRHGLTDEAMAESLGFEPAWQYSNLRTATSAEPWTVGQAARLVVLVDAEGADAMADAGMTAADAERASRVLAGVSALALSMAERGPANASELYALHAACESAFEALNPEIAGEVA